MNDLMSISDAELDTAIEQLKERDLAFKTDSGKRYAVGKMRELITLLETWGYKFNGNEDSLAVLWAKSLKEQIVVNGYDGVRKAVENWVAQDANDYNIFPKIPWIIDECKKLGGDPRVEKGRRVQKEAERQMELDHQKEIQRFREEHPDEWKRIEERAAKMRESENG